MLPTNNPSEYINIPVRIVCAAVKLLYKVDGSDDVELVLPSIRHFDKYIHQQTPPIISTVVLDCEETQGFLDNKGNFHDRHSAWKIAVEQDQILRRVGGDTIDGGTLFSENLY